MVRTTHMGLAIGVLALVSRAHAEGPLEGPEIDGGRPVESSAPAVRASDAGATDAHSEDTASPPTIAAPVGGDALRAIDRERLARERLEARIDKLERERQEASDSALGGTRVSGFVHVDWVTFRQSSQDEVTQDGSPLNQSRFLLRRARIRAEHDHGLLHAAFEVDGNTVSGPQVRPVNAEVSLKWPWMPYARTPWAYDPSGASTLTPGFDPREPKTSEVDARASATWFMVTVGLFRTPFGFEVQEGARQRPWLERAAMANALFPQSFDLGVRLTGGFGFVRYELGVMNGQPLGSRTFPAVDPNESKDLLFRVGGAGRLGDVVRVEGGISGLTGRGFSRGQPATKDVIQWQDSNDDGVVDATEVQISAGSPATPSQSFKRFAMGADLRLFMAVPVLGELAVRGEIVRAQNLDRGLFVSDPIAATRDLRQLGFYVGVSQEITRWGVIALRYDRYDPDADAREQTPFVIVPRDASMSTWTVSATARTGPFRLIAEFDHRKNALGRSVSGAPTSLADDSLTLRAEGQF